MDFIPNETFSKLICKHCKKCLSYYPIYYEKNIGAICGRCQPSPDAIRNHLYETAMEFSTFPCSFTVNGCLQRYIPSEIPEHEKWCKYRTLKCMFLGDPCSWNGMLKDLYDHFEKKHTFFILPAQSFEIDFINSHNENCLLNVGQDLYVVTRSADTRKNVYCFTVNYIGSHAPCTDFYFKVTFKAANACKGHSLQKKIGQTLEVNIKEIKEILGDPISILANIDISDKLEEKGERSVIPDVDKELLKELECFICFEYMHPPIYQCGTGHSFCDNCRRRINECPACKCRSTNVQNFVLSKIVKHINYPCKYDDCDFLANSCFIKSHEETCIYRTMQCPLKDYISCNSEVTLTDMYKHIQINHYENLLDIDAITYPFQDDDEFEDSVILHHDNKLFQMHFSYENKNFFWDVQLIDPQEQNIRYMFEVDFLDTTDGNRRIYFRDKCKAFGTKNQLRYAENPTFLELDQVKCMISSYLKFEIRVLDG